MLCYKRWIQLVVTLLLFYCTSVLATISQVRVINQTRVNVYVHLGGYSASKKIAPGKWLIFKYPFKVKKPGGAGEVAKTSLLVVTAGGRWVTTPNGFTYLNKPSLVQCLDYSQPENKKKTGNRVWTIKGLVVDIYCYKNKLKGYKQPWYSEP